VAKAIAAEPAERYQSVVEFDEDLRRYMHQEPVRARSATPLYTFKKFARRHRVAVTAATIASAATIGSLALALHQLGEARDQQQRAALEATRANEVTKFMTGLFTALDPRVVSSVDKSKITAKQILDAGRERIGNELAEQPETRIALLGTLAEMYGWLEQEAEFVALNDERIRLATAHFGEHHPIVYDAVSIHLWSDIYSGQYDAARATLQKLDATATARGERGASGDERAAIRLHAKAEIERRSASERGAPLLQRYARAIAAFEQVAPQSTEFALTIANYGIALHAEGDYPKALAAFDRALRITESATGPNIGDVASIMRARARTLTEMGRYAEAEADLHRASDLFSKSTGPTHILNKGARAELAYTLHCMGKYADAWREMAAIDATPTPRTYNTAGTQQLDFIRARMLAREARYDEAIAAVTLAINGWRDAKNNPVQLQLAETLLTELTTKRTVAAQSPKR
jgi:eukaryotic-like serine/threonine-protein kinase